jgi:quercetin dioxygenase-like cupin family protein
MTTPTNPRAFRFLDGTATILRSRDEGDGGVSAIEMTMPAGAMPPPHIHDEDESIHVLDGDVTFYIGDEVVRAGAGRKLVLPRGVPHAYRVESRGGARWVSTTTSGRLEGLVRALAREPSGLTTLAELVAFTTAAAANEIEIVGAPGTPPAPERCAKARGRFALPARPVAASLAYTTA